MTRYFEAGRFKGQRIAASGAWCAARGWYRMTVTWYASALNPLPPLVIRYRGADATAVAASLFGARYDCL